MSSNWCQSQSLTSEHNPAGSQVPCPRWTRHGAASLVGLEGPGEHNAAGASFCALIKFLSAPVVLIPLSLRILHGAFHQVVSDITLINYSWCAPSHFRDSPGSYCFPRCTGRTLAQGQSAILFWIGKKRLDRGVSAGSLQRASHY